VFELELADWEGNHEMGGEGENGGIVGGASGSEKQGLAVIY
jgi:hypothetical protein